MAYDNELLNLNRASEVLSTGAPYDNNTHECEEKKSVNSPRVTRTLILGGGSSGAGGPLQAPISIVQFDNPR